MSWLREAEHLRDMGHTWGPGIDDVPKEISVQSKKRENIVIGEADYLKGEEIHYYIMEVSAKDKFYTEESYGMDLTDNIPNKGNRNLFKGSGEYSDTLDYVVAGKDENDAINKLGAYLEAQGFSHMYSVKEDFMESYKKDTAEKVVPIYEDDLFCEGEIIGYETIPKQEISFEEYMKGNGYKQAENGVYINTTQKDILLITKELQEKMDFLSECDVNSVEMLENNKAVPSLYAIFNATYDLEIAIHSDFIYVKSMLKDSLEAFRKKPEAEHRQKFGKDERKSNMQR